MFHIHPDIAFIFMDLLLNCLLGYFFCCILFDHFIKKMVSGGRFLKLSAVNNLCQVALWPPESVRPEGTVPKMENGHPMFRLILESFLSLPEYQWFLLVVFADFRRQYSEFVAHI